MAAPGLAAGFAQLRASAAATPAPFWLPDRVHALILALLARIFGRLEDLITLWQAGLLPPPPALRPRTPRAGARAPSHRAKRSPGRKHPGCADPDSARPLSARRHSVNPHSAPIQHPDRAIAPCSAPPRRRRSARDPPGRVEWPQEWQRPPPTISFQDNNILINILL